MSDTVEERNKKIEEAKEVFAEEPQSREDQTTRKLGRALILIVALALLLAVLAVVVSIGYAVNSFDTAGTETSCRTEYLLQEPTPVQSV